MKELLKEMRLVWNRREYGKGIDGYLDIVKIDADNWGVIGKINVEDSYCNYPLEFLPFDCVITDYINNDFDAEIDDAMDIWELEKIVKRIEDIIKQKAHTQGYENAGYSHDFDFNEKQIAENIKKYKIIL